MRYPLSTVVSLLGLMLMCGCADVPREASSSGIIATPPVSYPVIVRIVGRLQTITVSAGPVCPLYSASGAGGTMLVSNATLDELRENYPDLYQRIRPAQTAVDGGPEVSLIADVARD